MSDPSPPRRDASPTDFLPRERRTIYVVDREFQFRYLTNWLFMTIAFIGFIFLVWYAGLRLLNDVRAEQALHTLAFIMKMNGIFVILLTVFMGLYTILLSHRVAGPAYRLSKCLQKMLTGNYDFTVTLRRRDYLKDVATDMNTVITDLRRRRAKAQEALEAAKRAQEKLSHGGGGELGSELERICAALQDSLRKVEEKGGEPPRPAEQH